jgi:hypothetical protein
MIYIHADVARAADRLAGLEPLALIVKMQAHQAAAREADRDWQATKSFRRRNDASAEWFGERVTRRRLV